MTDLERVRGIRCSLVVGEILTELMQEVMEKSSISPVRFCELAFNSANFKKLLTTEELNILQTLKTDGYRKLDINIMYKIAKFFRTFYVEPTQTWKGQPQVDNISVGDDMQRVKRARDFYGHNICPALTEEQMEEFFGNFGAVGKRMDQYLSKTIECSYETRISNYKTCPLDERTNKQILKENHELKNYVICVIHLKSGVDIRVVCDEETKTKIKMECSTGDKDDWTRIQLCLEGIKNSKNAAYRINIQKDEINKQSTVIKIDEALDGSVVLHILVEHVVLQNDARFLHELESFIRILTQVADLEYISEKQCYLIITAAQASFDIDSSSGEEDTDLILDIQIKNKVLENDKLVKDNVSNFMKVLENQLNGFEASDEQEMIAILKFQKGSFNMAGKSTVCTICDERQLYKQSTDWCIECEQALCTECKEFHAISKASRNHAAIPVTDYQTLPSSISSVGGSCRDHDEKYQMFCQTHDELLCPQCIEGHSDCKDVIALSKITKNVKTSETFRETEQCLVGINENILNIEDKLKDKMKLLNDQKDIILSEINQVRQKINEHLDQIEAVVRKDLLDIEQIARKEIETALTLLKEKRENNSYLIQQLENVIKHATDHQTFCALRQISSEITTTEKFLQSIIDNGYLDKIALELNVNEIFRRIPDNIKTFGSVRVIRNTSDLTLVKQKEKQAQLVVVQSASIQNIKLELTHKVKTNLDTIRGCGILIDGRLIFCDHSSQKRLVVTDNDGKFLCQVAVKPYSAFDVTCISNTTVALTTGYHSPSGITIIDINSGKQLKFIAKENRCYGITSVNGSLVYCVKGKGIEMMDINGENTTNVVRCDLPHYCYIASYKDKLYYNNPSTSTVTCCDRKGNTIWTFTDQNFLYNSRGISVDNDGHVYVVSNAGITVIVLSADGQNSRQILSEKDGLNNAAAIHYERSRKQLLVANYYNTCFLYEVYK